MAAEISFTLSEQDCVDAARGQYRRRLTSLRKWRSAFPILVGIASLFTYLTYLDSCDLKTALYTGAVYVDLMIVVVPLFGLAGCFLVGKSARRMFRQQVIHPESRMSWTDEGLQNHNEFGGFTAKWSDFYGWRVDRGSYTFFLNEGLYYLIPRHAISSEQSVDLEETLLRSGLSKR